MGTLEGELEGPRTEHWTENKSEPPRARHSEPSFGRRTVGPAVGPALGLQLGVAEETLEGALEVAKDGALDREQVGATEATPLGTKLGS